MRTVTLGTAGHIDHGKTALVRALTGVDTDRLPEEKRRGITIDLGFAHLDLTPDLRLAIIDVPGHEAFIRNMTAGATGVDLGLLVVAADEGIMPQTREHLAILDLLGVTPAAVAITKSDLVESDWLELVIEDLQHALLPTAFRSAPVIAVSAVTGAGLDALQLVLKSAAQACALRPVDEFFRLPIDRVFTVRGTGTVVTGTVWSGSAAVDQAARLLPSGRSVRIRALQRQGESVPSIYAGERAALALNGVAHTDVSRGETVVTSTVWEGAQQLTAHVRVIDDVSWSLRSRQRVHVHLGTAAVTARVQLLDHAILNPGEQGWVVLRLEEPLPVRAGDRFILRSFSPVTTVAGGVVFEWSPTPYRRRGAQTSLVELLRTPTTQLAALLALRGWPGSALDELPLHLRGVADTDSFPSVGGRLFHPDLLAATEEAMLAGLTQLHEQFPLRDGIEFAAFRRNAPVRAPAPLRDLAERNLVDRGRAELKAGGIALSGWRPQFNAELQARIDAMLAHIDAAGIATVDTNAPAESGPPTREILNLLESQGRIVQIAQHCYASRGYLERAAVVIRSALESAPRSPGELGAALGLSRKHLIPLLEHFDRRGLTRRFEDQRVLA